MSNEQQQRAIWTLFGQYREQPQIVSLFKFTFRWIAFDWDWVHIYDVAKANFVCNPSKKLRKLVDSVHFSLVLQPYDHILHVCKCTLIQSFSHSSQYIENSPADILVSARQHVVQHTNYLDEWIAPTALIQIHVLNPHQIIVSIHNP